MVFFPTPANGNVTSGKISLKKQPEIFVRLAKESADGHIQPQTLLINRVPSVCYINKANASAGLEAVTHTQCV